MIFHGARRRARASGSTTSRAAHVGDRTIGFRRAIDATEGTGDRTDAVRCARGAWRPEVIERA